VFHEIDMTSWPRAQVFGYFSRMAPTGYSLSVRVDVTHLLKVKAEQAFHFFPAYLWLVTKNLCKQKEFTTAVKDGKVGYYDTLTPFYAQFHEDTHTFSMMWTEYKADFRAFEADYLENQAKFGDNHGFLCQPGTPPENAYTVSCIPWLDFAHFAVHSYEKQPYFFPSVEAGSITKEADGRSTMALSLTCHHAATDGYHVKVFLDDLQCDMNEFEKFV